MALLKEDLNITNLKKFLYNHRVKLLTVFFIYLISTCAIGAVNYTYADDAQRQLYGVTYYALHYSRWGSEIAARFLNGGSHMVDLGLASFILSGFLLFLSSIIIVWSYSREMSWLALVSSSLLGLNPWFLQCLSYRFDNMFMAFSVLFATIPFLFWNKGRKVFISVSLISLFLMCNFYQISASIYLIMFVTLVYRDLINGEDFFHYLKLLLQVRYLLF